ncbi:hypothetical protein ABTX77_37425 [Streptomyces sp. NPDC097704]|uniref:hypothetical protein n=1 Tax=Streptomyces sp. NPDC097704 TaxID=3157101 RepID=UPI0033347022
MVTITIGENDAALGRTGRDLHGLWGRYLRQHGQHGRTGLSAVAAQHDAIYAAIRQAAPNATVYVCGYPPLFEETAVNYPPGVIYSVLTRADGLPHLTAASASAGLPHWGEGTGTSR